MSERPRNLEPLFRAISIQSQRMADSKLDEHGLNGQQGRMISYIASHEENGVIQKDLEAALHRRGASITSMLQGLERKGFIERRVSVRDERQKNLYVLPKGKKLLDEFSQLFSDIETRMVAGLSPSQQEELYQLLMRVVDNLSQ